MAGGKSKATCRVAVLGDQRGFFMLPRCVVVSQAYRSLSLHARATLVEIGVRFDGYNNGRIGVSQRALVDALHCSPNRIVGAIAELMGHGLIDVTAEGNRAERQAREYRLTFVSTPTASATNEYLRWTPTTEKSGATGVIAEGGCSATGAIASTPIAATGAIARLLDHQRKTAVFENGPATGVVSHICKPYPGAQRSSARGDGFTPQTPSGPRECERCGHPFSTDGPTRGLPKRFCSETCRKAAERSRHKRRQRQDRADERVAVP